MKNVRLILAGTTAGAAIITLAIALVLGPTWAIVIGTTCILGTIVLSTYILIKSNQMVLQRLSGGQKQHDRMLRSLWSLQQKLESQRHTLAQQDLRLNSLQDAAYAPNEETAEHVELREHVEQILQLLETQRLQKCDRKYTNPRQQLEEIFGSDSDVEILTAKSEGQKW